MPTLAFWLDVDNTLLANDDIKADLDRHLLVELGPELTQRFWDLYEQVRREKGVVDIPLALARFRGQTSQSELDDLTYGHVRSLFENYPFYQALYPNTLETLQYLRTLGRTVIVSDGDLHFQADKIINSSLAFAVEGRVLIYTHKQEHLDEVMHKYPADHYVMVDDKPTILADSKRILQNRLTTVFVLQGKYAHEEISEHFAPDIVVAHIGDLRQYTREQFLLG